MLKKLMMLLSGRPLKEKFTIKPYISYSAPHGDYVVAAKVEPAQDHYIYVLSEYRYESIFENSPYMYFSNVTTDNHYYDAIVIKRLDTGKNMQLTWAEKSVVSRDTNFHEKDSYTMTKSADSNDMFITKDDVGKTIEITIEPGGGRVARLLKRLLAFFQGGPQYA